TSVRLFDPNSCLQERLEMLAKSQSELKKDLVGATFLLSVLKQVKRELIEWGHLTEPIKELLLDSFGFCDSKLIVLCNSFTAEENNVEDSRLPDSDCTVARKNMAMYLIDREIERMEFFCQYAPIRAENERAADLQIRTLPSAEKAERLLRYETHLERQLYRAMDQLERFQRRRMGDAVPAPLNVNFGRGR